MSLVATSTWEKNRRLSFKFKCKRFKETFELPTMLPACLVFLSLVLFSVAQFDTNQQNCNNNIVHLFEWKWKDIAQECEDFLAPNGYCGVQLSPPSENVIINKRPWFERYQPVSYKLRTRSGDEAEFRNMVKRCNKVGVRIYPDVVFNHMAALSGTGTGGSISDSENKSYPAVPYTAEDFHPTCTLSNYSNPEEVRSCELEGLRDLDQSKEYVRGKIVDYLNKLIDSGVAGIRVDGCKHMLPEDLKVIFSRLNNLNTKQGYQNGARPFIYQEVIDMGDEPISSTEYTDLGAVTEFRFSSEMGKVFLLKNNSLKTLRDLPKQLLPSNKAVVFVDNHDNQRQSSEIVNYKTPKAYKMAVAYMLGRGYGITRIMSSYEFSDKDQGPPSNDGGETILSPSFNEDGSCGNGWVCEHRWPAIRNMIEFHNVVNGSKVSNWTDYDDNQISFCRGEIGFLVFNQANIDLDKDIPTCLAPGTYCDIITGHKSKSGCTGKLVSLNDQGIAHFKIGADDSEGVMAIHVNSKLE